MQWQWMGHYISAAGLFSLIIFLVIDVCGCAILSLTITLNKASNSTKK